MVWRFLCLVAASSLLLRGIAAPERTNFLTGEGTNGWTISSGAYVSPTYPNSVKQVMLGYSGENVNDAITISAVSARGDETRIAVLSAASSAATLDIPPSMDFRSFRIAAEGGMNLASFAVSIHASYGAFPLSALSEGAYTQDFDSLAAITASTGDKEWLNGMTLPYWQAWSGADPAEKFTYNGGAATASGFYALASNRNDQVRAFGARAKQGLTMTWGMAFTNDTDWTICLSNVAYSAQQWGFANTTDHALVCSYLVSDRLDWFANMPDGWVKCSETAAQCLKDVSHDTPVCTAVDYAPSGRVRIPSGSVLLLKWTFKPPASGSSALMAIDNIRVAFEEMPRPLMIRLAEFGGSPAVAP